MAQSRRGGIISVKANGSLLEAKGNWTYNLGKTVREAIMNADGSIAGFKEMTKAPFLEGVITDSDELDVGVLRELKEATITLELANGKVISFGRAFAEGDWDQTTEEGEISARFGAHTAQEIRS